LSIFSVKVKPICYHPFKSLLIILPHSAHIVKYSLVFFAVFYAETPKRLWFLTIHFDNDIIVTHRE